MVKAIIPKSLDEALQALENEKLRIVCGGTDMLVQNHNLKSLPINYSQGVIYVASLEELQGISEDDNSIYIGAAEPLESILENPLTPELLKMAISEMASPAIRHTGTLGGNIANASPAGDSLVPLYLLGAILEIKSSKKTRHMSIRDFITGVRKIELADDEIITKIIVDKISFTKTVFKKVGPRRSDAISKLSFAAGITIDKNMITDLRFAFGAVNITVVRHPEIECQYIKMSPKELKQKKQEIIDLYSKYIKPIDDQRSNKEYRKQVCLNLLGDFIDTL